MIILRYKRPSFWRDDIIRCRPWQVRTCWCMVMPPSNAGWSLYYVLFLILSQIWRFGLHSTNNKEKVWQNLNNTCFTMFHHICLLWLSVHHDWIACYTCFPNQSPLYWPYVLSYHATSNPLLLYHVPLILVVDKYCRYRFQVNVLLLTHFTFLFPLRNLLLLHCQHLWIKRSTWRGLIPHSFQELYMTQALLVTLISMEILLLSIQMMLAGIVISTIIKCEKEKLSKCVA